MADTAPEVINAVEYLASLVPELEGDQAGPGGLSGHFDALTQLRRGLNSVASELDSLDVALGRASSSLAKGVSFGELSEPQQIAYHLVGAVLNSNRMVGSLATSAATRLQRYIDEVRGVSAQAKEILRGWARNTEQRQLNISQLATTEKEWQLHRSLAFPIHEAPAMLRRGAEINRKISALNNERRHLEHERDLLVSAAIELVARHNEAAISLTRTWREGVADHRTGDRPDYEFDQTFLSPFFEVSSIVKSAIRPHVNPPPEVPQKDGTTALNGNGEIVIAGALEALLKEFKPGAIEPLQPPR